jgi:hypothetical protein
MEKIKKFSFPIKNLILTPYDFLIHGYKYDKFELQTVLLGQPLYILKETAVLTGFIGYPALLTTLMLIENAGKARIFFVGTAGLLSFSESAASEIFAVTNILPDSFLEKIFPEKRFELHPLWPENYRTASVISTDIPLREDQNWLAANRDRAELVEMELFGLCSYYDNISAAFLVSSDIVGLGKNSFFPRGEINKNLNLIFTKIIRYCNEK